MAQDNRVPVWLDCDPGHDDVFAILLAAYHPGIRLLGISTVFGNAPLEKTTWNATRVLTAIARHDDVPVYAGAAAPLARSPAAVHAEAIHGASGLDGTALLPAPRCRARGVSPPPPTTTTAAAAAAGTVVTPNDGSAAATAAAAALWACAPGTAWVVATGCLTNVARLFGAWPALVGHVRGLSIMGGAVGGGHTDAVYGIVDGRARVGNWTPWAEFNMVLDPEAAASIFDNEALAGKTTMAPLDVTHLVLARQDVQELLLYGPEGGGLDTTKTHSVDETQQRVGKTTLRTMLVELLMFFAKTYKDHFGIVEGPPLHDPVAVAAVLTGTPWEIAFYDGDDARSSPAAPERFAVRVVTEGTYDGGGSRLGQTVATLLPAGAPGVRIPRGLDIPAFWTALEQCVQRADAANAASAATAAA